MPKHKGTEQLHTIHAGLGTEDLDLSYDTHVTIAHDFEHPDRPWTVRFGCCHAEHYHSRFEAVARRIADGHACPTPYPRKNRR